MASLTQAGITFGDGTSQTTAASGFPSGTVMLFVQSTAPTGWTKSTAHNDKALRVVSGSVSSGGSVAFSSTFSNGTVGSTTLSISQIPSHYHAPQDSEGPYVTDNGCRDDLNFGGARIGQRWLGNSGYGLDCGSSPANVYVRTSSTGSGESHTHTMPDIQYVDVIICIKN